LISATMFAVLITLGRQTQLAFLLELISSFFFSIAFYLLLSLWSGILSQVQQRTAYSPLRIGIYVGMLIATVNLIFGIVWLSVWPGVVETNIHQTFYYILPASQALVGLLFLFYAVRFQLRKNDYNASRDTKRALSKLAWLAVLGFFTFIVKAVTNFVGGNATVAGSVGGTAANYIAEDIAATARAFGILMVLGVRLPEARTTTTSGTTSSSTGRTFISWGGWSKGWRRALYGSAANEQQSTVTSTMNESMSQSTGLMSTTGYTGAKAGRTSKATARVSAAGSDTRSGVTTPMRGVSLHAKKTQRGE